MDYEQPDSPLQLAELTGPNSRVFALSFSPEGDRLAAGVGDGTIWLWDLSDTAAPTVVAILNALESGVLTLTFSSDGDQLIGSGQDASLMLWNLRQSAATDSVCRSIGDRITPDEWTDLVPTLPYSPPCEGS